MIALIGSGQYNVFYALVLFLMFLCVDYVDFASNFCYNNFDKDKSIKLGTETSQVWTQKVR